MCDYSLHAYPNRLAKEGEQLVVHSFFRGSIGLASPADLDPPAVTAQRGGKAPRWWSWAGIQRWLQAQGAELQPVCAVCIPPGARLVLRDIPQNLQHEFHVGEVEEVKFVQLSANEYTYRDAICFSNGGQALLQRLHPGQRVDVLCLSCDEPEVRAAEQHAVHI